MNVFVLKEKVGNMPGCAEVSLQSPEKQGLEDHCKFKPSKKKVGKMERREDRRTCI